RQHNEIWPARLEVLTDARTGGDPIGVGTKADILAIDKRYKLEPAPEREMVGVIEKQEKGGYVLVMRKGHEVTREPLVVYGDLGDLLAPCVAMKVKLVGKQVAGAAGMRPFAHTLPGRLEVLPVDKEEGKKPAGRPLTAEELAELRAKLRK